MPNGYDVLRGKLADALASAEHWKGDAAGLARDLDRLRQAASTATARISDERDALAVERAALRQEVNACGDRALELEESLERRGDEVDRLEKRVGELEAVRDHQSEALTSAHALMLENAALAGREKRRRQRAERLLHLAVKKGL